MSKFLSVVSLLFASLNAYAVVISSDQADYNINNASEDVSTDAYYNFNGTTTITADNIFIQSAGFINGSFTGSSLDLTAKGSIVIDAIDIFTSAVIVAQDGTSYFDILIKNAQNLHVGNYLTLIGEDIVFEFSDGLGASLDRLDVSYLNIYANVDSISDTTVSATDSSCGTTRVCIHDESIDRFQPSGEIPEPSTLALLGLGLVGFRLTHRKFN